MQRANGSAMSTRKQRFRPNRRASPIAVRARSVCAAAALVRAERVYVVRPEKWASSNDSAGKSCHIASPGLHYKLPWPVDKV